MCIGNSVYSLHTCLPTYRTSVHACIHLFTYIRADIYTCPKLTFIHTYMHTCVHTYPSIFVYILLYIYICICKHVYIVQQLQLITRRGESCVSCWLACCDAWTRLCGLTPLVQRWIENPEEECEDLDPSVMLVSKAYHCLVLSLSCVGVWMKAARLSVCSPSDLCASGPPATDLAIAGRCCNGCRVLWWVQELLQGCADADSDRRAPEGEHPLRGLRAASEDTEGY